MFNTLTRCITITDLYRYGAVSSFWSEYLGDKSIGKVSPQHQAAAHFSAQQLMLILGVKGEIRSSPLSIRLQASTSAPVSAQKAKLLRDTNGSSTAAHHPRSKRAHRGDECPHPSPPCFFYAASTGPATELFWVEAASFREPSERRPYSFCTTHWPKQTTTGTHTLQKSPVFSSGFN